MGIPVIQQRQPASPAEIRAAQKEYMKDVASREELFAALEDAMLRLEICEAHIRRLGGEDYLRDLLELNGLKP